MEAGLDLAFSLRGKAGRVRVSYGANHDPRRWGFDQLNLPFPLAWTVGFPVMQAAIDYPGTGYAALMGWLQVVTVENRSPVETYRDPDVFPIH